MRRSGDCIDRILDVLRNGKDGLGLWIVELDCDACMTSGQQPSPRSKIGLTVRICEMDIVVLLKRNC